MDIINRKSEEEGEEYVRIHAEYQYVREVKIQKQRRLIIDRISMAFISM